MAIVTKLEISKKNKNRINIFVDDDFFMTAFSDVILKNKIIVGLEINEIKLSEILKDEEIQKASAMSVKYLERYVKTRKEVENYLEKKGFTKDVVLTVIKKLEDYGYINDEAYARMFKEAKERFNSIRLIKMKLKNKGILTDKIENLNFSIETEMQTAQKLAEKHLKNKEKTKENLIKTQNYLLSKGFSYETSAKAVKCFLKEEEDENWD